ncbi:MAG: NYN domain-containing protein [Clostridia bacterium]|nr:NYN domain-containing protein [Clostridia bacterium]
MGIALLIDIDNAKISLPVFQDIVDQIERTGHLVYCKVYGFNERKHINFGEVIEKYGFDSTPTMRYKKRSKSQLDSRILIDAVSMIYTKPFIDTFAIVAGVGDLVPLLSFLKSNGKKLMTIASESVDGNDHMYDMKIKLSVKYSKPTKLSKKELSDKLRQISARSSALLTDDDSDAMKKREELIREIEDILATRDDASDQEESDLYDSIEDLLTILK